MNEGCIPHFDESILGRIWSQLCTILLKTAVSELVCELNSNTNDRWPTIICRNRQHQSNAKNQDKNPFVIVITDRYSKLTQVISNAKNVNLGLTRLLSLTSDTI